MCHYERFELSANRKKFKKKFEFTGLSTVYLLSMHPKIKSSVGQFVLLLLDVEFKSWFKCTLPAA